MLCLCAWRADILPPFWLGFCGSGERIPPSIRQKQDCPTTPARHWEGPGGREAAPIPDPQVFTVTVTIAQAGPVTCTGPKWLPGPCRGPFETTSPHITWCDRAVCRGLWDPPALKHTGQTGIPKEGNHGELKDHLIFSRGVRGAEKGWRHLARKYTNIALHWESSIRQGWILSKSIWKQQKSFRKCLLPWIRLLFLFFFFKLVLVPFLILLTTSSDQAGNVGAISHSLTVLAASNPLDGDVLVFWIFFV